MAAVQSNPSAAEQLYAIWRSSNLLFLRRDKEQKQTDRHLVEYLIMLKTYLNVNLKILKCKNAKTTKQQKKSFNYNIHHYQASNANNNAI